MASFPPIDIVPLVNRIAAVLRERKQTITISESACGGLISSYLVSVPGASEYYHGGTLTYALKSRLKLSGWSNEDINTYTNLKLELGSTYTLSETGWAGPTGSSGNDSSVGTVFFAIVSPTTQTSVRKVLDNVDPEDRSGNMVRFAKLALEFLLEVLLDKAE
ncbi:hypothetical protein DV451_003562 [Geotrichum candidum]|uniref:CinA C-terminal domain-containing protein n=1 Tax=Geotrichum candidum TaxID=1173061 RepID=A0A9P5G2W8_GEOCN|nr:hypothetical protein DV451_003562 [Geotrichum candidum]KAF5107259.1 hypothetical protein DV453_003222 [Geotrichum candidum]